MNKIPADIDIDKIAELFHTTKQRVRGLLNRKTLHKTPDGNLILDKSISGVESGTNIFLESYEVVRGFPKIQRAMMLQSTLAAHFTCKSVAVEEKMNGYNTRVAFIDNKIIALTRGGHTCPYTTEKAQTLIPEEIFTDYPDIVLCGEMVGPDSPYVPKNIYNVKSLEFFLFDIREKNTGIPLSVAAKYNIAEQYNITCTKLFGIYPLTEAYNEITRIIKNLGACGREGVVIKDPTMKQPPLKYTSSQSNCTDLQHAFTYYHDYAKSFFYSRIAREAFQSVEWNETPEEIQRRCIQLGEGILQPMVATIKKIQEKEKISENVQIRVKSLRTAEKFKEHLRILGIDAVFHKPEKINNEYLIKIQKINQRTNDKTESILTGNTW